LLLLAAPAESLPFLLLLAAPAESLVGLGLLIIIIALDHVTAEHFVFHYVLGLGVRRFQLCI
jgi:hypothetical protein